MTIDPMTHTGATLVRLIDGRTVLSDAEEWRHECEARSIIALPTTAQRREWLEAIDKRRGKAEGDRLRATIKALWAARVEPAP